jgi:hypothetical protein
VRNALSWCEAGVDFPVLRNHHQRNMGLEDVKLPSLTSETDGLTELHQSSGLLTEHHTRRTEAGFVIRASRLPNCVPLPASKIPLR